MATNQGQKKTQEFLKKNKNYFIGGIVILLLVIYFAGKADENASSKKENQTSSQTLEQENKENAMEKDTGNEVAKKDSDAEKMSDSMDKNPKPQKGSLNVAGTLRASDNPAKGKIMIESARGKIYVTTKRDFSALVGKPVTLSANGTLNAFTLVSISEEQTIAISKPQPSTTTNTTPDRMSSDSGAVKITGTLQKSDNPNKGSYIIKSASGNIYLHTKHDYSAWIGSTTELTATGTLQNFTNTHLAKK